MWFEPNPGEKLLTLCAWCGAVIVEAPMGPDGEISHGICGVCESKFEEDFGEDPGDADYDIARKALS